MLHIFCVLQLDSQRSGYEDLKEAESGLRLEFAELKQEVDEKSRSLVALQSELSSSNEVSPIIILVWLKFNFLSHNHII